MKKKLCSLIMLLSFLFLPLQVVEAKANVNVGVTSNVQEVKASEEVIVTLRLDDFVDINKGINAYKATFSYDTTIFEEVTESNFTSLNHWEYFKYNAETHELVAIHRAGVNSGNDVLSVRLKVKENAKPTNTIVSFRDVVVSEGREDLYLENEEVLVSVIKEQEVVPILPNEPNHNQNQNQNQNNSGHQNGNQSSNSGNSSSNVTESGNFGNGNVNESETNNNEVDNSDSTSTTNPSDGETDKEEEVKKEEEDVKVPRKTNIWGWILFFAFINLLFLSYYFFKRYHNEKQNKYRRYMFFLALGLVSLQFVGSVFATAINFAMLGELNGDSEVNYVDAEILERHLVHLKELEEKYLENADMNADKKITITDLTLLVQKLENTLDYNVEFADTELENLYFNKNETISLSFEASVSYGASIEFVKVNGTVYPTLKNADTDVYSFQINTENTAGVKELTISEVILNNGKTVKTNYKYQIDVLKDIPEFKNYVVTSDINQSKQILDFDIVDGDSSVTNASLVVYDGDEVIHQFSLQGGHNKVEVLVEDGYTYNVSIIIDYDLKTLESLNGEHTGNFVYEKELVLNIDYQFSLSNIKSYDSVKKETTDFERYESIVVGFDSTNATIHEPVRVKINGKTYEQITKENNRYYVVIDEFTEVGSAEIKLEEIVLANGKTFTIEENNTITTSILKRKPTITDFTYEENKDTDELQVGFQLQDEDQSVQSVEIQLLDGQNNEISKVTLSSDEINSNSISKILTTKVTDKYRVKVVVSYIQKEDVIEEVLLDKEIDALTRIEINNVKTDKIYYEKEEVMNVIYQIETNKKEEITHIRVNNVNYIAKFLGNGEYQILANAPGASGVQDLFTSKVIFEDKTEIELAKTTKVEVLKSVPSVQNVKQENDLDNGAIKFSFDLKDEDNSFLSGKAIVTKVEDGTTREFEIQKGDNELSIPLENAKLYQLDLHMSYDRDTNTFSQNDNLYEDVYLASHILQLLSDYELTISNIKTYKQDIETIYFNKDETIVVRFDSSNISHFKPAKVVINGNTYALSTQGSSYQAEIPGYANAGVETLNIEKIILSNTYEEVVENKNTAVHILKDALSVLNFGYERTNQNKLKVRFNVVDLEDTFVDGTIRIVTGGTTLLEESIQVGENSFLVDINGTDVTKYQVLVNSSYNLDPAKDTSNIIRNVEVLNEEIELSPYAVELKDVVKNTLFYKNNEVSVLDITNQIPTDVENYYVKIEMKNIPTYYANVKNFVLDSETNRLYVVILQTDFIQYTENNSGFDRQQNYSFPIAYQNSEGMHPLSKSASELFEAMRNNPTGTFVLDENLDASDISTSSAAINVTFKGTLDGQGHKITNLPTVLFASLNKATVKNLVIENAKITNNAKGILANTIENNSVVVNTHILNSSLSNGQGMVGGFVGEIKYSTIKQSSAVDISIRASNTIGGIAGQMSGGSVVEDCYVTGNITGTISHGMGARMGGITGWDSGIRIDHVYTKVNLSGQSSLGGFVGGPDGANPVVRNSVSFGNGGYRLSGFGKVANMTNVYEYSKSTAISHVNENVTNIKVIDTMYDKAFYKDTLGFDESIWYLDLVDHEILPILKNGPLPHDIASYEIEVNKNNIPNYAEIRKHSSYKAEKEILYYNLSQLKPFSDTRNWLEMANAFNKDALIANSKISFIVPLDGNGKNILGLTTDAVRSIAKIRVVYANKESEIYEVEHLMNVENLIATYKIKGMDLEYEFAHYLKTIPNDLVTQVLNLASNLDYATDIATLTSENESRLYVDFYNESVKGNIRDIIINYILNNMDMPTYSHNSYLMENMNSKFTEEFIKQLLYSYNYYEKWYHIDLDGIKLSDFLFFNGVKFSTSMDTDYLINGVINTNTNNRATNKTVDFYNAIIKGKVGMNFQDFLPYVFKALNGYDDPSDWMVDHFKGILYEQPATGAFGNDIIYRIWPIMTRTHQYVVLPILSAPQEDMYMISCPTQFIIGSLNRYSSYLNKDGNERTRMYEAIKGYANALGEFYGTSAGFIPNAVHITNTTFVNAQFDTRFYFPASDKADAGTQSAGTTRDPVMKWVYEAIGNAWGAGNGSGAYANGYNVWWVVDCALGGVNRAIHVFTHETAHNQDGRYFYGGNGRRGYTGAEAHADGVIAQDLGVNTQIFNITKNFALDSDMATNLTYERINTAEKIDSYYSEMFETKYVLEYLAAKAFLRLTPEEQAKVAIQLQYSDTGNSRATSYVRLTADDFRNMNLQTVEDLWDNKLAIRGTGSSGNAQGGSYGYDSFFNFYFHIPNNPNGTSDTNTFKNTGYEMLGFAGYDKGFINYMSGRSKNDVDAIQKITGDSTMTWKTYKLNRYQKVEENLSKIKYYDTQELINLYERALKTDANNNNLNTSVAVTKLYYGIIKRATNDFRTGGIYTNPEPISITSATQLIEVINNNTFGNYRIDADLDFSSISPEAGKTYYIENRFLGTIDGNGHKFIGMKYPLFNSLKYAHVKDILIERPEYLEGSVATLAVSSSNSIIYNVNVVDSNVNLPSIKNKSGLMFTLGTNEITVRTNSINSVEDFLAIDSSNINRGSKYILNADLDFSGYTKESGESIISGIFSGVLDGNGHTIRNSNYVLFHGITGNVKNLKLEDFSILNNNNAKGILTNSIANGTVENVAIHHSSIVNNSNQVGGLSGAISSSTINRISLTDIMVQANNTLGGLAGQIGGTNVRNVLVTGRVKGTLYHGLGSRTGGITGWLSDGASIENVVVKAEVNGSNKTGNGGLIGGPNSGNVVIKNSISLSTGANSYRIAGFNVLNNVVNVYESATSNSGTNINANNNTKVLLASSEDILNPDFYRDRVLLSNEMWNFDTVRTLGYPTLK